MTAASCPNPRSCPVPDPSSADLRRLRTAVVRAGEQVWTAYHRAHWPSLFNDSGRGDARFSPLAPSGRVIPTLYVARTATVALLESVFHEVHAFGSRAVSMATDLAPRGLVQLQAPRDVVVFDLRDQALDRLDLERHQLVATTAAHYPCTRAWAELLHGRGVGAAHPTGIAWGSRIAELARAGDVFLDDVLQAPADEAFVLFGDALPTSPRAWAPDGRCDDLTTGRGLVLAEAVAERLGAVLV